MTPATRHLVLSNIPIYVRTYVAMYLGYSKNINDMILWMFE